MIRNKQVSSESFTNLKDLSKMMETFATVEFAYLFGSSADGTHAPLSDIDIAVYFKEGCDLSQLKMDLLGRINHFLETDEVDLVVLNTAPISIAGRVLLKRKLLYCRNDFLRHRFESLSLRKFFDFRVFEENLLARRFGLGR